MSSMYTREEILAMPAGRELDALVAEHIFGKQVKWTNYDGWTDPYPIDEHGKAIDQYSECIIDAWEVVEKMHQSGLKFMIRSHPISPFLIRVVICTQDQTASWECDRPTAPEAISKVALLSLLKED